MKRIASPPRLYRVAYIPDVAAYTDWEWQRGEGRWDDPRVAEIRRILAQSMAKNATEDEVQRRLVELAGGAKFECYRVIYTADTRTAAYVEVLQDFRKPISTLSRAVLEQIQNVVQDDRDIPIVGGPSTGIVPADHIAKLYVGEVDVDARSFVDVENIETVQWIRDRLIYAAAQLGIDDISRGEILGGRREFTQLVSKEIYDDPERLAGIYHNSAIGTPHANYAFFETPDAASAVLRSQLRTRDSKKVEIDDPDLVTALQHLRIEVEGVSREIGPIIEREREREEERERDRGEIELE